ncbi:MAG: hypothetical protein RBU25_14085, partial [Lentisphaeria bacterium]|nr:hypothetical protein [Lentisphaeria bacterium]
MRRAESPAPSPAKITVVTDIGSPEAAALRPSEKRILLRTGQFLVDRRAEAETSLVIRSPESNVFQTCSGAGRRRLLTADGELAEVEICLKVEGSEDGCVCPGDRQQPARLEVWVVPLDGRRPFTHRADLLHVRQSTDVSDKQPGEAATRESVRALLKDPNPPGTMVDADHARAIEADGNVLIMCRGRAARLRVSAPRTGPLFAGQRALVFTGVPGSLRALEDKWMIPSTARVLPAQPEWIEGVPIPPGDPADIAKIMESRTDMQRLTVREVDGRIEVEGAVTRHASSGNDAVLAL